MFSFSTLVLVGVCAVAVNGDDDATSTTAPVKRGRDRENKIRPETEFLPPTPTNVNRVRPADIKYIASLGDSITAGFRSYTNKEAFGSKERYYVGNNWATGGDGKLETKITLANILKELNPSLTGFSTGVAGDDMEEDKTNLNMAIASKWSDNLKEQAEGLVARMKARYSADSLAQDWKRVNIFIGSNDMFGQCRKLAATQKPEFKANVKAAIQTVFAALPRTIVNIVGIWHNEFSMRAYEVLYPENDLDCLDANYKETGKKFEALYNEALHELETDSDLSGDDHAVVVQDVFKNMAEPLKKADGTWHYNFYTTDVFHISNYGSSLIAKACPFIRTPGNSVSCPTTQL